MKIVSVILLDFNVRLVGKEKNTPLFQINALETDLNGARIPCEIQTFNEELKNKLQPYSYKNEIINIPFENLSIYKNKFQYTIDPIINHPDFIILSQI